MSSCHTSRVAGNVPHCLGALYNSDSGQLHSQFSPRFSISTWSAKFAATSPAMAAVSRYALQPRGGVGFHVLHPQVSRATSAGTLPKSARGRYSGARAKAADSHSQDRAPIEALKAACQRGVGNHRSYKLSNYNNTRAHYTSIKFVHGSGAAVV